MPRLLPYRLRLPPVAEHLILVLPWNWISLALKLGIDQCTEERAISRQVKPHQNTTTADNDP